MTDGGVTRETSSDPMETYDKKVEENIGKLLMLHPSGIARPFFDSEYFNKYGENIDYGRLGCNGLHDLMLQVLRDVLHIYEVEGCTVVEHQQKSLYVYLVVPWTGTMPGAVQCLFSNIRPIVSAC